MTARSPRGSLSGASDVASDFEDSLKDLQQNNRYEISNLTLIAKESTEHAQSISKALEKHIKTVRPSLHHVTSSLWLALSRRLERSGLYVILIHNIDRSLTEVTRPLCPG